MNITYEDVLGRLKEERERLRWSQKEMSQCVRMTQSNYSKVELGLRRLNYYDLQHICESEIDVYYIYTGEKRNAGYADSFFQYSYEELLCMLRVIYDIVVLECRKGGKDFWKEIYEKIRYVTLIKEQQKPYDIFLALRHSVDYRQQRMADTIGVDVKKLRDLENGRCLPDSELLCRIYALFQISPAALLKDKKGMASELSVLLGHMEENVREEMVKILETICHISR